MKKGGKPKAKLPRPQRPVPKGFGISLPEFRFSGDLRPGQITPRRIVPDNIKKPDYAKDGRPGGKVPRFQWDLPVLNEDDIEKMRVSGRLAREVLDIAGRAVKPGVLTEEIDVLVHEETLKRNAYPSPLNYNGFPKSCCTSINEVICHGIPSDTALVEGDIVNIDVTLYHDGFHGDCSEMFMVGDVDEKGKMLARITYESLQAAISICGPKVPVNRIGGVIESYVAEHGYSVVRNFCGHGVNSVFHTTPNVLHYRNVEPAGVLEPGVTFTIEPMINEGTERSLMWPDNWTATTVDGKRSAQYEHTLLVTDDGIDVLTAKTADSPKFFWED